MIYSKQINSNNVVFEYFRYQAPGSQDPFWEETTKEGKRKKRDSQKGKKQNLAGSSPFSPPSMERRKKRKDRPGSSKGAEGSKSQGAVSVEAGKELKTAKNDSVKEQDRKRTEKEKRRKEDRNKRTDCSSRTELEMGNGTAASAEQSPKNDTHTDMDTS